MLYKAKALNGFKLHSLNGELGSVKEFYFDVQKWKIRYLVVETGNWLSERQVLISTKSIIDVNKKEKYFTINLTKEKIKDSPSLDSDKPVSRQFEESYYAYYGWPLYWVDINGTGPLYPYNTEEKINEGIKKDKTKFDRHLWSSFDVSGQNIQAIDGDIGHIVDLIIDESNWKIRYIELSTRNWLPGKKVLISPQWIEHINWKEAKVIVNLTRDAIKNSPEYIDDAQISREYEENLHKHYKLLGYWKSENNVKK